MQNAQATQAFTSLAMLQYVVETIGFGKCSSIPMVQAKKVVAHVMVKREENQYTVQFWRKNDLFSFDAYARVPAEAKMGYNKQLKQFERRQPVIRSGKEVGYWSYGAPDKKTGLAKINGFVTTDGICSVGDRVCSPYVSDIETMMVRLNNMMGREMCRIFMQKGALTKCDRLDGFDAAANLALEYRRAHRVRQPIVLRHQIERFGGHQR